MKNYFEVNETDEGQRIDIFNENWYYIDKRFYPSVTFILSEDISNGLMFFAKEHGIYTDDIVKRLGEIGTEFHHMIEILLKTNEVHFDNISQYHIEVWRRVVRFYDFYEKHLIGHDILGIEIKCCGADYAGTIDLISHKDGLKYVWDWKSSKAVYDHHKYQVSAYAKAVNADVANIVVFPESPKTKQGYSMTSLDSEQIEDNFEEFLTIKAKFNKNHKEPLFQSLPIQIKIGD